MRPHKSNVLRVTSEESSPINESTSKWKIPHYYKIASSSMTQTVISEVSNNGNNTYEQSGATNSPAMAFSRSNNRINIMNTPVPVLLEDPNQPKTRKGQKAKAKKNGEMVFVNFTVRDTAESPKKNKTSRQERMLRMLKSSDTNDVQSQVLSVADTLPVIEARSAPASTPASASKRIYSSFLKSGKIGSSTISSAGSTTGKPNSASPVLNRELTTHNDDLIFAQRSNSCNMVTSATRITPRPQISRSTSANVVLHSSSDERLRNSVHQNPSHQNNITFKPMVCHSGNVPLTESNNKIDLLKKKFLQTATSLHSEAAFSVGDSTSNYEVGLQNSPRRTCRSKANANELQHPMGEIYTYDHDDNDEHGDNDLDSHFLVKYDDYEYYTANNFDRRATSKQSKLHRSNTFSTSSYNAEENDASIAFNKIFTRKRQNAGGGSTGSVISSQQAASPFCFSGNMGSISVSSQRYSPSSSFSPGISRSNTRGSFSNRITRDVSSAYLVSVNANDNIISQPLSETVPRSDFVVGIGTYIDTQVKQRYCHKKKQESISEVLSDPHRYTEDTPLITSTVPTPGDSVSHILQGGIAGQKPGSLLYGERDVLFTEIHEDQDLPIGKNVPDVPPANIADSPGTEVGLASVLLTSDNSNEMELPLVNCNSTSATSYQKGNNSLQRTALETLALDYENNSDPDREATEQKQMQEQIFPFYSEATETGLSDVFGNGNILENYMEFDIENAFTILLAEAGTVQYGGDDSSKEPTAPFNSSETTSSAPLTNVSPLVTAEGEFCPRSELLNSGQEQQQQRDQHLPSLPPPQQQQQQLFQCTYKFPGADYQRNLRGGLYGIMDNKEYDGSNVLN